MTELWRNKPVITVRSNEYGEPTHFIWAEREYTVRHIIHNWELGTDEWRGEGALGRICFTLRTTDDLICTIHHDLLQGVWQLVRTYE